MKHSFTLHPKKFLFSIFLLLAFTPPNKKIEIEHIAVNNNLFAFNLYKNIAQRNPNNIFISPYSISTALAMTYAGAANQTEKEMMHTLCFEPNTATFHYNYNAYSNFILQQANNNVQLKIANKLWASNQYEFLKTYKSITHNSYGAGVERLNFNLQPELCRQQINTWVENNTENRIKDLLPQGSITKQTQLVLTNAIYFKGSWKTEFDKAKTRKNTFYTVEKNKIETDFMHKKASFNFINTSKYKTIMLPYNGQNQSMVIVLPHKSEEIYTIEKQINTLNFEQILHAPNVEVQLAIPKFKITLPLEVGDYLKVMGMEHAFSPKADFSNMSKTSQLAISRVIHKAFIEIDETGTEAAAATAVVMVPTSSANFQKLEINQFIADKPFLFYIIDNESKAILFMGRMMNPAM